MWGWLLVWLNTDLASSLHILSPVSPQKKEGQQGLCNWVVVPPVITDAARLELGDVVGKAKQWCREESRAPGSCSCHRGGWEADLGVTE